MEAGGDPLREPHSPNENSLKNVERGELDHPAASETPESCFSNKTGSASPLHSTQETVEIPKSGKSSAASLKFSHGVEQMADVSGSCDSGGASWVPRQQFLWGEEMSGTPALQSGPSDRNGVPKDAQHWNVGSIFPLDKYGSPNMFSPFVMWGELKTGISAAGSGSAKPTRLGNGKLETEAAAHDTPEEEEEEEEEEDFGIKLSHWHSRKPESEQSPLQPTEDDDPTLLAMFHAVAGSHLAVRSQQKDEPDFTLAQKVAILRELYHAKPLVFLERFRTALREDHLPCFHHLSGNYEADFYCAEVRRAGLGKTRRTRVRNKRYAALQQLIQGGEYFSDEQMRSRDPLLYEHYIGQYLSDLELEELDSCKREAACSLSGALLDSYQEGIIQRRLQVQQEQEDACLEEEEEASSESGDDDEAMVSNSGTDEWVPDTEEKAFLREEFTSRMYQRFLDGKDRDFDYSEVDENPDFDNLDIVSRDEEERYFDGEEPEEADSMEAE
ncbi:coiled-coil domain-containing protein 97 [Heteronotia binoei]|uniref:coiled-coil domain-containing protein 97 n=1 Tax=Heteronotia binoei TaxID=13085 RepID=UPI00292DCD8C|nr:coiled-coil domain-containing protein 97 [Heteronotia binoei]